MHASRSGATLSLRQLCTAAADPWAVLGIGRGAGRQEIKMRFYELAKQTHPDVAPPVAALSPDGAAGTGVPSGAEAAEAADTSAGDGQPSFIDIVAAFETLMDSAEGPGGTRSHTSPNAAARGGGGGAPEHTPDLGGGSGGAFAPELELLGIAVSCEGASARLLRKLPFQGHAFYAQQIPTSLANCFAGMRAAVALEAECRGAID